jgi:hypothetical protein
VERQETQETRPKDAGLLVMLLIVVIGTLVMAWVADQTPPAGLAPTTSSSAIPE